MSAKRGLGGAGLLDGHLGIPVPTIVRRSSEHAGLPPTADVANTEATVEPPLHEAAPLTVGPDRDVSLLSNTENVESKDVYSSTSEGAAKAPATDIREPPESLADASHTESEHGAIVRKAERRTPKPAASSRPEYRVGTRQNPYERRRDGIRTQKVSFTAPHGFSREIDRFCLDQDVQRSEWIAETLAREIERVKQASRSARKTSR